MSWNYRVCKYVKHGQTLFGIREVFYEDDGSIKGHTPASVDDWEDVTDVGGTLDLMKGALERPILTLEGDLSD